MTLWEFAHANRGYSQRVELHMHQLAWVSANLMNMWRSKGAPITVAKLLPKSKLVSKGAKLPPPGSLEEFKRRMRAKERRRTIKEFWSKKENQDVLKWTENGEEVLEEIKEMING